MSAIAKPPPFGSAQSPAFSATSCLFGSASAKEVAAAAVADAAAANYSGLSSAWDAAVKRFVFGQEMCGNWPNVYEMHIAFPLDETNTLKGMKLGTPGTKSGTPTFGAQGVSFTSTQYIDLGYSPASLGSSGRGYGVGIFSAEITTPAGQSTGYIFGAGALGSGQGVTTIWLRPDTTPKGVYPRINMAFGVPSPAPTGLTAGLANDLLYIEGTSGADGQPGKFHRGLGIRDDFTLTDGSPDYSQSPSASNFHWHGASNGAGHINGPGQTSNVIFTTTGAINYNAMRAGILRLLSDLGITTPGRRRIYVVGDSNSTPDTLGHADVWWESLGDRVIANSVQASKRLVTDTEGGGTSGENLIDTFRASELHPTANEVIILLGNNDCFFPGTVSPVSNAESDTLIATAIAGYENVIADCRARGVKLRILSLTGLGAWSFGANEYLRRTWDGINDWLEENDGDGYQFINIGPAIADPSDNYWSLKPEYQYIDGVHLNTDGELALGDFVLNVIAGDEG